jgi:hypothetical protein
MRRLALLLALTGAWATPPADPPAPAPFVQAVEFPYYLYPANLWERELVWLKNIGVRTVEFPIPWNWHQVRPGEFDFSGNANPRRDLAGLLKLLRRLGMRAWMRPFAPVPGWLNGGTPAGALPGGAAQRQWFEELGRLLGPQTASHGGPVAYVEGRGPGGALLVDAPAPPGPILVVSANDPAALIRSRDAIAAARGALLWRDVEDALYPAGWAANPATLVHKGAVGLSGDERISAGPLRRGAALLRNWSPSISRMHAVAMPPPAAGKLPDGVHAVELVSPATSAVSISNAGKRPFHDELRVRMPGTNRTLAIPGVSVPPGESLWLPLAASLGPDGLCRECSNFSPAEQIVYATEELLSVEFENGILAMEFAAPEEGEVILQLAREPVGPFLAAGKPAKFDWDDKALRARLAIPANHAPGNRVRIGIAMEEPEAAAFFNDARRLLIGRDNAVATEYSSAQVASRSRLLLPEGFTATASVKSPNEIGYQVAVPADSIHLDYADLALEADGLLLGRAHLQLFLPATIRLPQSMELHFGQQTGMTPEPPTAPINPKGGASLDVVIRNNSTEIQTYRLEASGAGLDFFPAKTEISVGAMDERPVPYRIFSQDGVAGLRDWRLRVTGGTDADIPMRVLVLPRDRTVAWTADLDGDGSREWVLESRRARAVFSTQDGGRWVEFTAKDSNVNFLPEQGLFAGAGAVEVEAAGDSLVFSAKMWKRTVRLVDGALTVEQTTPLPPDPLAPEKRRGAGLSIERTSPSRVTFTVQ